MNIVIYINSSRGNEAFPPSFFVQELLNPLLDRLKDHQVLVVADGFELPAAGFPKQVKVIEHRAGGGLWWHKVRLPALLRSHHTERLLSVNSVKVVSGMPSFVYFENEGKLSDRNLRARLAKLTGIFGRSHPAGPGSSLTGSHPASTGSIKKGSPSAGLDSAEPVPTSVTTPGTAALPFIPALRPARSGYGSPGPTATEATRLVHTGGRSYFLYAGPLNKGLMEVIRAFSVFKKRQKSDWKLVLAGSAEGSDNKFMASLAYYKYREDLTIIYPVSAGMLPSLLGAAYAAVFPRDGSVSLLPEVFASGVPAIVPDQPAFHGQGDEALVYYEPGSEVDIAENMMTIYKDEGLRSRKSEAGLAAATLASWQDLAAVIAAGLLN